jgi:hypothetical protein
MEAAAEKRRRKLKRYTNTPAARAARAITEARHDAGTPIPTPEPYDLGPDEFDGLSSSPDFSARELNKELRPS